MSFCERKTQEAVNAEWNSMAGEWDDVAAEYCDQFHKMLWEETQLNPNQALHILDFGCGTGLLTEHLLESSPQSTIVCIDAAEEMIMQVQQKIQAREWQRRVEAVIATLGRYDQMEKGLRDKIDSLAGTFDLVVASSVMNFIPPQDLTATVKVLGKLLKPGGILCHSDWPDSELFPGGITLEKAEKMYRAGGFKMKSHTMNPVSIQGEEGVVFVGIAEKDQVHK
mmetsp:Transcript_15679/g.29578  ORF Transcript_15679/g.29578 Transcript_15679/m.29578 type:complete len:224 (+) Transcript_15679:70-741(+)